MGREIRQADQRVEGEIKTRIRWEDINSGVNWGVVLLYGAAISLGIEMKDTGAAKWVAESFLGFLAPLGADQGLGLWGAVSVLTTFVTNTMSNGAAVAVLGPIVLNVADVAGESPIILGFITAVSSASPRTSSSSSSTPKA